MTLPVSRRGLGLGIAAGAPLLLRGLIELARRPLVHQDAAVGPRLYGDRIVIENVGTGPVFAREVPGDSGWSIVLIHGWSGCADVSWHAMIPELAGGPTIYAIDLPGHGDAPLDSKFDLEDAARRVAAVVDRAAEHGPVTLVGHSMGGAVSLTGFGMGILDNVDRYFAVATADRFATPSLSMKLWAARIFGAGDRSPFILRDAWKRAKVSRREMVAWILQHRPSSKVLTQSAAALSRFDLSDSQITMPASSEWIVADADTVISVSEQLESADRHGVPVMRIDASHAVAMEHPIELGTILATQRVHGSLHADAS